MVTPPFTPIPPGPSSVASGRVSMFTAALPIAQSDSPRSVRRRRWRRG